MLKRVQIENFRSCQRVVLDDLGPLNVLVGRNAVGKSNILRAISWIANYATSQTAPTFSDLNLGTTRVTIQVVVDEDTYDYSFTANTGYSPASKGRDVEIIETLDQQHSSDAPEPLFNRDGEEVKLRGGQVVSIGAGASCMPALVSVLPPDSGPVRLLRPLLRNLETIRYYPLEPTTDQFHMFLVRQSEYDGWVARNRGTDTPAQAVMMRLLDMGLTREDEFSEVKQLLGRDGLGLIDDMRVEKVQSERGSEKEDKNRYYYLSFRPALQPRENPRYFWFDGLSSGTQRLVAIITAMIYDHSAVMLLEHPEDGIHRALLRKLIGVLQAYSGQSQLIIASHSADVFNALDPAAVRLVTMEDGQTGVRKLTAEEVQAAAKYLEEEGSLADFLEIVADD